MVTSSNQQPQPAPSIAEQRVSNLVGDRMCVRCGYNLMGQPVLREPHYQMLIVRCPECAAVASVQEYPLLGRWANRWAAALAGLWFVVFVGLWIGSGAALFGMSVGSAEIAAERYDDRLYEKFSQWQAQQALTPAGGAGAGAAAAGATTVMSAGGQTFIITGATQDFTAWWKQQDRWALFAEAGGLRNAIEWGFLFISLFQALVAFCFGCVWAVVLFARGRGALLAWGAMVMAIAALFAMIPLFDWLLHEPGSYYQAARAQLSAPVLLASLAWAAAWLILGLMVGRPVVRGLLRLLLPPRLCSSLALLWLTDGLEPPRLASTLIPSARRARPASGSGAPSAAPPIKPAQDIV